jgi:hypothetical protein
MPNIRTAEISSIPPADGPKLSINSNKRLDLVNRKPVNVLGF